MKILKFILTTAFFGVLLLSCSNETDYMDTPAIQNEQPTNSRNSHVSFNDVQALVKSVSRQTRAAMEKERFEFIIDNDNDTLFYVANHPEGGWTMYASDKRVPAIVAENDEGYFNLKETEQVMNEWFEAMKEDMKAVRQAEDNELNFTEEEIRANRDAWDAVCNIDEFIQNHTKQTRARRYSGHYELYETIVESEVYDSINHMTQTRWHQSYPYNAYCPMKSYGYDYAPAGCVAIAGAQMLYYLHYKIGTPDSIPDAAYCNSTVSDPVLDMNQWMTGINTWSTMPNHGNPGYYFTDINGYTVPEGRCAAPLIANVGMRVNMHYTDSCSGAYTNTLVSNVFYPYGISCQYVNFNSSTLYTSLQQQIPVIASAYTSNNGDNGHAFIIDGYKRSRTKTTYRYVWVYDYVIAPGSPGPLPLLPEVEDEIIIEYSSPYITHIKMNWGWGNHSANNTWYISTGNWNAGGYSFNYMRKMIYNFHSI